MSEIKSRTESARWIGLLLLAAGVIAVSGFWFGRALRSTGSKALPAAQKPQRDFGMAPAFSLIERSGKKVTDQDLRGKVAVFGFIYTSCPGTCLMVTGVMARLRAELPRQVQIVSMTVDPRNDTPSVLAEYAKKHAADAETWWFLTGDRDDIYRIVRDGFKLQVEENELAKSPGDEPITHSSRLAVVDAAGTIRGYFDSADANAVELLKKKVLAILKEAE